MSFTFDTSKLRVDGVTSIIVGPIQPDIETTAYVRLIQIYTALASDPNRRPVLEVAIYGGDQTISDNTPLEITLPGGIEF